MILRPHNESLTDSAALELAQSVFNGSPLLAEDPAPNKIQSKRERIQALLTARGLGIEDTIKILKLQSMSDDEGIRDRALDKLMKIHEMVPKEDEGSRAPTINIIMSGEQNQLMGILLPDRS